MTEPAQVVSFRMAPDVLTALRDIANQQGCTVSDLMRRGALMALEEPNRMVITWTSPPVVSLEPATDRHSSPVGPGEGDGTGAGEREAHGGAQGAMDAAIEAARLSLIDEWSAGGGWSGTVTYDSLANTAVRAAEPILRKTVAEEIARALESKAAPKVNPRYQETHYLLPERAAEIAREVGRG